MQERIEAHKRFWRGEGPCLILIPAAEQALYDLDGYPARFENPRAMWESEMARARPLVDWPTDGVPTVRPNLGVIFIPSMAGLPYQLKPDQMPWPGPPIGRAAIRAAADLDPSATHLMRLADEFYAIHREHGDGVAAYQADTQGVFDIAHLLYGDEVFYELPNPDEAAWVEELLGICRGLYVRVSRQLKALLGEEPKEMIHGHGTSQGIYFPHAGVRMAEDTATLLSPATIEQVIVPAIAAAAAPFGGVFAHYCGKHAPFFEQLCCLECVRAIDLGNPEMFDARWLLEQCGSTGTVLYSRIAAEEGETWEAYVRRIAGLVRDTGARVILRAAVFPDTREDCEALRGLWHELTD